MKKVLIIIFLLISLFAKAQVTPQFKGITGGITVSYHEKIPSGYDSLMYFSWLRTKFIMKMDSIRFLRYADNGLTNSSGTVVFGGTLYQNTDLDLSGYRLRLGLNNIRFDIDERGSGAILLSTGYESGNGGQIAINTAHTNINYSDTLGRNDALQFGGDAGAIVYDDFLQTGLQNVADYSAAIRANPLALVQSNTAKAIGDSIKSRIVNGVDTLKNPVILNETVYKSKVYDKLLVADTMRFLNPEVVTSFGPVSAFSDFVVFNPSISQDVGVITFNNMKAAFLDTAGFVKSKASALADYNNIQGRLNLKGLATTLGYTIYGDSIHDDRAAIQAAINYAGTHKLNVFCPSSAGYLLNNRLDIPSNLNIDWNDQHLIRNWVGAEGEGYSTIGQSDFSTPITNVIMYNLYVSLVDTTKIGRGISLNCNNCLIQSPYVRNWVAGPAIAFVGDNSIIDNFKIFTATKYTGGGIRVYGGNKSIFTNGIVYSSDDAFQFVVGANDTSKFFNRNITNESYSNCHGTSYHSRLQICGIDYNLYCKINGVSFNNVSGTASGANSPAIGLQDFTNAIPAVSTVTRSSNIATYTIPATPRGFHYFQTGETVYVTGCSDPTFNGNVTVTGNIGTTQFTTANTGSNTTVAGGGTMFVQRIDSARIKSVQINGAHLNLSGNTFGNAIYCGRVHNIEFNNISVKNEQNEVILVADSSSTIHFTNIDADKPTAAANCVAMISGANDVSITNSTFIGNTNDVFSLGAGTGTSTANNIRLLNNQFTVPGGSFAVNMVNGISNIAAYNTLVNPSGSTTSKSFRMSGQCVGCQVVGNNDNAVTTTAITDVGTGDIVAFNLPITANPITLGGTGNVTAPSSGQIFIAQSSTATLPKTVSGDATISNTGAVTLKTNINLNSPVYKGTATAINSTATVTAAQLATGVITCTSAATETLTLPTTTNMVTQFSASQGYTFIFTVDNVAGANTVTIAVNTGTTAVSAVTGGTTLTISSGSRGTFRIYFASGTVSQISRID